MRLTDEQIIDVADKHLYKGYLVFAKEVIDEFCRLNNYDRNQQYADKEGGEPVRYEYRWLNPANNPNEPQSALDWKLVELRNSYVDTMEDRVRELEAYRYDGKPIYEVRALYTKPQLVPDDVVKDKA